jgi:hypothetical protein
VALIGGAMAKRSETVTFTCWKCGKDTTKTVTVEESDDDLRSVNVRKRSVKVKCAKSDCGVENTVDV